MEERGHHRGSYPAHFDLKAKDRQAIEMANGNARREECCLSVDSLQLGRIPTGGASMEAVDGGGGCMGGYGYGGGYL